MFSEIPSPVLKRMKLLEERDGKDRIDGTPRLDRLRQIPRETGKFIALLAAESPDGNWIEIGTSAGYSTMWLALAARQTGRKVKTFEILESKAGMARETFERAGIQDVVDFTFGDALDYLAGIDRIAFCFLDAEKEVYADCYELVVPKLVTGGLLVADNAINHAPKLQPMLERALADERVDSLIVPIGNGELVCRKKES